MKREAHHLQTNLQVLLDLERIDQVSEAVFKQDGKDMVIPLYMAVCLAGYANLADIHVLSF